MKDHVFISLHVSEVEDIIDDLLWSAKKLNLRHGQDAGQDQKDLANKIDSQLQNYLKNQNNAK